jgi:hypothetical protein
MIKRNLIILLLVFPSLLSTAQDSLFTANPKKWNYLSEIYLLFPYMNGVAGIGKSLEFPIDANPGDIFSKVQMGAMLYLEAKTERWAITSDLIYMNVGQDVTPGMLIHSGKVNIKLMEWEAAGLYRLTPFWEVGAGGRLNYLQSSVNAQINVLPEGTEEASGRHHKTWCDPVIITRLTKDINDRWLLQLRADVGGFGVASKFAWQVQGYAGYRFSKLFQLTAGYRIFSIDYNKGDDRNQFLFDMDLFGPVLRFGFNF